MGKPQTSSFTGICTKANLIALGTSGFYLGLYYVLIKSFSTLQNGILSLYSNAEGKIEKFDLFKTFLDNSRMDILRMAYFGLIIVGVSFLIAQLVNHKKKNLTPTSFIIAFLCFGTLAIPYILQIIQLTIN